MLYQDYTRIPLASFFFFITPGGRFEIHLSIFHRLAHSENLPNSGAVFNVS